MVRCEAPEVGQPGEDGDHDIVVGEVVAVWIAAELHKAETTQTRFGVESLYHIGSHYFGRGEEVD